MRPYKLSWLASSPTAISQNSAVTAGISLGVGSVPGSNVRPITLTSAQNVSAATFAIIGTLETGQIITENLVGPNANTVTSVNSYANLYSIIPNTTVAGAIVNVGTGNAIDGSHLAQFTHDYYNKQTLISYSIENDAGAVSVTPQYTLDLPVYYLNGTITYPTQTWYTMIPTASSVDPFPAVPLDAGDIPISFAFSSFPVAASRILVGPATTGTFDVVFLQQGGHY